MTEKDLLERDKSDVEWATSTEQGRRFMWKLLSHCGIYQDIVGSSDEMLKQIGRRQVGLFLLGILPEDKMFDMMREAKNRSIEEKLENGTNNRNITGSTSSGIDSIIGDLPSYSSGDSEGIF